MLYVYGCPTSCGYATVFSASQASVPDHVCLNSDTEDQEPSVFLGTIAITPPV